MIINCIVDKYQFAFRNTLCNLIKYLISIILTKKVTKSDNFFLKIHAFITCYITRHKLANRIIRLALFYSKEN